MFSEIYLQKTAVMEQLLRKISLQLYSTGAPTFHHNNGISESLIDLYAASSTLKLSNVRQYCTLDNPSNLSSHDPIAATILVKDSSEKEACKFLDTYTDFLPEKIIWDEAKMTEYHHLADKALSEAALYWSSPEAIPLLTDLFSKLLVQSAKLVFKTKPSGKPNTKKSSRKVILAEEEFKRAFKKWKRAGRPKSKTDPIKYRFTTAKYNLQRLRRYEEALEDIITS